MARPAIPLTVPTVTQTETAVPGLTIPVNIDDVLNPRQQRTPASLPGFFCFPGNRVSQFWPAAAEVRACLWPNP